MTNMGLSTKSGIPAANAYHQPGDLAAADADPQAAQKPRRGGPPFAPAVMAAAYLRLYQRLLVPA